jgi:hypothetical protein
MVIAFESLLVCAGKVEHKDRDPNNLPQDLKDQLHAITDLGFGIFKEFMISETLSSSINMIDSAVVAKNWNKILRLLIGDDKAIFFGLMMPTTDKEKVGVIECALGKHIDKQFQRLRYEWMVNCQLKKLASSAKLNAELILKGKWSIAKVWVNQLSVFRVRQELENTNQSVKNTCTVCYDFQQPLSSRCKPLVHGYKCDNPQCGDLIHISCFHKLW